MAKGNFLENVQLQAEENDFQGLPFAGKFSSHFVHKSSASRPDQDSETLVLSADWKGNISQMKKRAPLALKIVTAFGFITAQVKEITSDKTFPDPKEETVANLL